MVSGKKTLRKIAWYATSPIWFPLFVVSLPLMAILILAEFHFLPAEALLRWKMKKRNRLSACRRGEPLEGGTLIVEYPTFSWSLKRIWWTPDNVRERCPVAWAIEEAELAENEPYVWPPHHRWLFDEYLDAEKGKGLLVKSNLTYVFCRDIERTVAKLRGEGCARVDAFSGGRELENLLARDARTS